MKLMYDKGDGIAVALRTFLVVSMITVLTLALFRAAAVAWWLWLADWDPRALTYRTLFYFPVVVLVCVGLTLVTLYRPGMYGVGVFGAIFSRTSRDAAHWQIDPEGLATFAFSIEALGFAVFASALYVAVLSLRPDWLPLEPKTGWRKPGSLARYGALALTAIFIVWFSVQLENVVRRGGRHGRITVTSREPAARDRPRVPRVRETREICEASSYPNRCDHEILFQLMPFRRAAALTYSR